MDSRRRSSRSIGGPRAHPNARRKQVVPSSELRGSSSDEESSESEEEEERFINNNVTEEELKILKDLRMANARRRSARLSRSCYSRTIFTDGF